MLPNGERGGFHAGAEKVGRELFGDGEAVCLDELAGVLDDLVEAGWRGILLLLWQVVPNRRETHRYIGLR